MDLGSVLQVPFPRMIRVKQHFSKIEIDDITTAVRAELNRSEISQRIGSGGRIAVAVGSRGIANLAEIIRTLVQEIKRRGGEPFIIPAMGSHGGATAEGQRVLLAGYGITEERIGAPVLSSMEVEEVARLPSGLPVYFDRLALGAQAVIPVNRIKPHTSFRGPVESGIMKMLTIGLGKHRGATTVHQEGFARFSENLMAAGRLILQRVPVAFGLAILENAFDRTARVEAVLPEHIEARERELLVQARELMARLLFDHLDVLVVDRMGKEISGTGMDPNVLGRYTFPWMSGGPSINRLVVLDLTEKSHGNATGVGLADIATRRLVQKIDQRATYLNVMTSTNLAAARIPVTMDNDREAIALAIRTANRSDLEKVEMVRIRSTLELEEIWISEPLWEKNKGRSDLEVLGPSQELSFDGQGNLEPF